MKKKVIHNTADIPFDCSDETIEMGVDNFQLILEKYGVLDAPRAHARKNLGIGTGRRKTSVARVYVKEGNGKIFINGKELSVYFSLGEHVQMVRQPLAVTASENKYDVVINVYGGGCNGQAGACRHGLARALCQVDHANYTSLRNNGFLTRDPRMVERKKYGQPGARRRFQFSKR